MIQVDPQRARTLRLTILAVVLLLLGGIAQTAAQPKATLLDPPDLVIFNTGEVKGALAPGG